MTTINILSDKLKINNISYLKSWYNWMTWTNILDEISNYGCIAGGSILYCYDKNQMVNDIDIFVDNIENFHIIVDLITTNFILEKISKLSSVIQIDLVDNPKFQIIMVKNCQPLELINEFDFDYIQCAYCKQQFYTTDYFLESLKTKEIKKYKTKLNVSRLDKAVRKGYKLPSELEFIRLIKTNNQKPIYKECSLDEIKISNLLL